MTLRQRFTKDPLKLVKKLDAFPKVPEEYQQSTRIGGTRKLPYTHIIYGIFLKLFLLTVSVISRAIIIYLIYIETSYYLDSRLIFKFKPDTDMDTKLKIHVDITVATPCSSK